MFDLLLKGGRIYDGSGMPSFTGDVAVAGGKIAAIGRLKLRLVNAEHGPPAAQLIAYDRPDGAIERTRDVIMTNRAHMFSQREYRGSRHSLSLMMIRCLSADYAVADGRWELRNVTDTTKKASLLSYEGQATLVVSRAGAIPEVVGDDGACATLVTPGDVGELEAAIIELLDERPAVPQRRPSSMRALTA